MIAAAIFDMDGLLIDSEPFWHAAHIEAVKKYGPTITEDAVRAQAGRKTIDIAQQWVDAFELDVSPQDLCDEIIAHVIRRIKLDGRALPGVFEVLELFASHDIPMAIASSATPEVIEAVIERLKLQDHFLFAYSAVHEPKGKPHPGVFLTTASKLGVRPADCIVFEDAISGVRAAKSAGMKCVAVPESANRYKPEFKDEADAVLPSLSDIDWNTVTALFYE